MAYNGFPATYQPMQYQNYMQPQMQQPQIQPNMSPNQPQNSPMIWVQGETGAKSYLLAPNTTLPLWDSENQRIYLKSTDASGMPSMKVLDYTIRDNSNQPHVPPVTEEKEPPIIDFVTHDELEKFKEMITHKIEELKEDKE